MERYQYIIVGGGLAGGRAAENIRKVDADGSLLLIAGEAHLPYQRPPLSKGYLRGEEKLDKVYLKDAGYYDENHIEVMESTRVTKLSPADRKVTLDGGRALEYERLLLATGGRARSLDLPGADLAGVFTLRSLEDSEGIRRAAGPGRKAVVLGGGFIGSEVAASLTQMGTEVTQVFPEERLQERLTSEEYGHFLEGMFRDRGVRLVEGARIQRMEGDDHVQRVILDSGETLAADLVVMGLGIELNTGLAREAGLELDERGAVVVDEYLRTSDERIYAAGDIAAWPDPTFGRRLRVEHWDVARSQGLRAGRNMAGEEKPYTTLPYFFSDMFDLEIEVWGDLSSWEETLSGGAFEGGKYTIYCLREGRLAGVLAAGASRDEGKELQSLVRARPTRDEVRARVG